jgi:hypothetical protein
VFTTVFRRMGLVRLGPGRPVYRIGAGTENGESSLKAHRDPAGRGPPSFQGHGTPQKGPFRAGTKFNDVGKSNAAARPARQRTLGFRSFLQQEARTNRQGFDVFPKLPSHKSKNFHSAKKNWPVLSQGPGGWDAKRSNFPGPKRGVPCTELAPGRELSIAQGPGLIALKPAFLRILSRPWPIWAGPF